MNESNHTAVEKFSSYQFVKKILAKLFSDNNQSLLVNECFITVCPKELFLLGKEKNYFASPDDYSQVNDPILNKNKIIFARLINKNCYISDDLSDFNDKQKSLSQLLLHFETEEIKFFLSSICRYLQARESDKRPIINHGIVKVMLSEIVENISELELLVEEVSRHSLSNIQLEYAKKLLIASCMKLAKLQGGHGFLDSGMIEMLSIFQIMNKVYL
jgi:hypothetical protein